MTEEQIHRHVNDRPDSITIGTPSKGGEVKIYINAKAPVAETNALIDAAFAARLYAKGKHVEQEGKA